MIRHILALSCNFVVGAASAISLTIAVQAADHGPRPAEPQAQAEPSASESAPLIPPPGISIMPSPQRTPPAADGQVPGCAVRNLKPLDLLV